MCTIINVVSVAINLVENLYINGDRQVLRSQSLLFSTLSNQKIAKALGGLATPPGTCAMLSALLSGEF